MVLWGGWLRSLSWQLSQVSRNDVWQQSPNSAVSYVDNYRAARPQDSSVSWLHLSFGYWRRQHLVRQRTSPNSLNFNTLPTVRLGRISAWRWPLRLAILIPFKALEHRMRPSKTIQSGSWRSSDNNRTNKRTRDMSAVLHNNPNDLQNKQHTTGRTDKPFN